MKLLSFPCFAGRNWNRCEKKVSQIPLNSCQSYRKIEIFLSRKGNLLSKMASGNTSIKLILSKDFNFVYT